MRHEADGCIERFNDRLVVKGYTQQEGLITQNFSLVVQMTTIRALFLYLMKIMDFSMGIYLHVEVYMEAKQVTLWSHTSK